MFVVQSTTEGFLRVLKDILLVASRAISSLSKYRHIALVDLRILFVRLSGIVVPLFHWI